MRPLLVLLLLGALCAHLASTGILVMRSCTPAHPNTTVSADDRSLSVACCQDSQCSRSGAAGLGVSVSASLLWALLQAAW